MKEVLISIKPRWCEFIASFKKTVEVRKTRPLQIKTPFKVYIYCTKNTKKNALHTYINSGYGRREFGIIGQWRSGKEVVEVNPHLPAYRYNSYLAEGKVIGEFICDHIEEIGFSPEMHGKYICKDQTFVEQSCVPFVEMFDYLGEEYGYGWHISDLVIYTKPRELSEFRTPCAESEKECPRCVDCEYYYSESNECIGFYEECTCDGLKPINRPPQSWCYCYVEEIK